MDKETLVKLAQPAATGLLALSICLYPLVAKATENIKIEGSYMNDIRPIHVKHVNSCS